MFWIEKNILVFDKSINGSIFPLLWKVLYLHGKLDGVFVLGCKTKNLNDLLSNIINAITFVNKWYIVVFYDKKLLTRPARDTAFYNRIALTLIVANQSYRKSFLQRHPPKHFSSLIKPKRNLTFMSGCFFGVIIENSPWKGCDCIVSQRMKMSITVRKSVAH